MEREPVTTLGRDESQLACRNCGDPTVGNFCPTCGQRKADVRVSLHRLILEVLDDQLSLNSALPRTLVALLFQPGRLTAEYVRGRIARYVQPFRLYLVSSVIFFVLLTFVGNVQIERSAQAIDGIGADSAAAALPDSATLARAGLSRDSLAAAITRANETRRFVRERAEWRDNVNLKTYVPAIDRRVDRKLDQLALMEPRQALQTVMNDLLERGPLIIFLLLPLFAGFMKLIYIRSGRYYVEHFIFALHTHAFVFVLFAVLLVAPTGWLAPLIFTWMMLYFLLAMRRVYRQGWIKTSVKYFLLFNLYMIAFAIAVSLGIIATVALV